MYEELVKRLRNCTSDTVEDCAGCPYQGGYKGTYCMNGLIEEAADAIEDLSGLIDRYGGETGIKNLQEYASKYWDLLKNAPHWIPVTETLPEKYTAVLAAGNGEVACGLFVGFAEPAHVASWDLDNVAAEPVTHWMPLPEPPEEMEP